MLYTGGKWPVWYTPSTRVIPTKKTQTITFDAIADRYSNQGDLTLAATCTSNLPVSFQVRNGPATLSNSVLKFNGAGTVTIRAVQDGNDQFAAATFVEQSFKVLVVTEIDPLWANAVKLYPNPAHTTLTVELPGAETFESLSLQTLAGATVVQPALRARQRSTTLEVGHLPKGIYLLRIQTLSGTATKKVVKE